jgi:hypothetical protein
MAKDKKEDPEVTIFGEVVSEKNESCQGNDYSAGFMFIFFGSILLLNSLNILPWSVWGQILRFWPLLLILAGVRILVGNNPLSRLLMLIINFVVFGSVLLLILSQFTPEFVSWLPQAIVNYLSFWGTFTP